VPDVHVGEPPAAADVAVLVRRVHLVPFFVEMR
jgi:hypothetical protein